MPVSMQHMLAVYIKFMEFQYTLEHFRGFPERAESQNILDDLKIYLSPEERNQMEQMQNMMHMMDMVQNLQNADQNSMDPMNLMMGMLSPEQQERFVQYSDIFEQQFEQQSKQQSEQQFDGKGASEHERMDESSGSSEY
jgi:leucyl aminopeptidase